MHPDARKVFRKVTELVKHILRNSGTIIPQFGTLILDIT